ncbi:MAG: solute carrier family 23 protein [bacterium]
MFGLFLTCALIVRQIKGAIFLGILLTTGVAICLGVTHFPFTLIGIPDWKSTFLKLDISSALELGLLNIVFTFLFVNLFDNIGTLAGVGTQGNFYKDGDLPRSDKALTSDATGTIIGSLLGTSTVTTYIESASGVAVGGRTGFVSVVVAIFFLLCNSKMKMS